MDRENQSSTVRVVILGDRLSTKRPNTLSACSARLFETVCTAPDGITVTYKSPLMYSVTHFTEQQWAREVRIRSLRLELRSLIEMRAFASTRLTPEQAKFYWQVISRPRYDEGTPVWKVMQKRWPELEELCPNWHRTGEACTDEDWEFGIRAWGPYGDPLGAKP